MRRMGKALGSIFLILVLTAEAAASGAMQPATPQTTPQTTPPPRPPKVATPARTPAPELPIPDTRPATPFTIGMNAQYARQASALRARLERLKTQLRNEYQRRRQMLWEQLRQLTNKEADARSFKHYAQADAYQQQLIQLRNNLDILEANYMRADSKIADEYYYEMDKLKRQYRAYY